MWGDNGFCQRDDDDDDDGGIKQVACEEENGMVGKGNWSCRLANRERHRNP